MDGSTYPQTLRIFSDSVHDEESDHLQVPRVVLGQTRALTRWAARHATVLATSLAILVAAAGLALGHPLWACALSIALLLAVGWARQRRQMQICRWQWADDDPPDGTPQAMALPILAESRGESSAPPTLWIAPRSVDRRIRWQRDARPMLRRAA